MEIQHDISFSREQDRKAAIPQFQKQLEDGVNELKADVTERPFLWLGFAFIAGSLSHTFPVRLLFMVVMRLIYWLAGPVVLLMGVIKISDFFSSSRRYEPS